MLRSFIIGVIGATLALLGGLVGVHVWCGDELPSLSTVRNVETSVRTEIYDANGELAATLSREDRRTVHLHEVTPDLINAIIAIEDRKFYQHWGVDPFGLVRAAMNNLRSRGRRLQGGSTITQQLAWNLFLTHEQTLSRKLKELVMTLRLERSFSKDEILELYMNEIYFGDVYGVETASRYFFGKSAADLDLAEAAVLAGIPKHPARYSPVRHPDNATGRRNVVLAAMLSTGKITRGRYEAAVAETLRVTGRHASRDGQRAPYFTETIRQRLLEDYGGETTYEGGLKVVTTLDPDLQHVAEESLERQLAFLERENRYDYLEADSIDAPSTSRLQGAVVALDPRTGAIRALVGGRDFDESEFNRAIQARRQPGSAFKPFVFATAVADGRRVSDTLIDAAIVRFLPNGDRWEPTNFSKTFRGVVTLREALAHSINIPSVLLMEDVGLDQVIATAHQMGIESPLPRVLSLALGTGEVSLLELTGAYGPFANRGIYTRPYMIERIEDRAGHSLFRHVAETREALDERVAYVTADLMKSVIDHGTGQRARRYGLEGDCAGKTGTTDDYTDAWFVGFNDDLLCGVWVGFDQHSPIGKGMTGAQCALPVWTDVMKAAGDGASPAPFAVPKSVVVVKMCVETARLATPYCPETVDEVFIEGTEPTLPCPYHEEYDDLGEAPMRRADRDVRDPVRPARRRPR